MQSNIFSAAAAASQDYQYLHTLMLYVTHVEPGRKEICLRELKVNHIITVQLAGVIKLSQSQLFDDVDRRCDVFWHVSIYLLILLAQSNCCITENDFYSFSMVDQKM